VNYTGSKSISQAVQNIRAAPLIFFSIPPAAKMQRDGQCQPAARERVFWGSRQNCEPGRAQGFA